MGILLWAVNKDDQNQRLVAKFSLGLMGRPRAITSEAQLRPMPNRRQWLLSPANRHP